MQHESVSLIIIKLEALEKKLKLWQTEQETGIFVKVEQRIMELKSEITQLQVEKTRGAMLRCKVNWCNLADRPTKYFLNLEKSNYNRKAIHRLQTEQGPTTDPVKIQNKLTNFYKNLYKSKGEIDKTYIESLKIPVLNSELQEYVNEPLSLTELDLALKELKANKTPGVDGLPPEFYKVFWLKLKHFFLDLFNEIIRDGIFHLSARQGIITLIEKVGKDPLLVENWRPISLLCADYKIYAKIVANRLQKTLDLLIHPSQTGFIKGRNIAQNIMQMQALMEFCESHQQSVYVVSFDFQKAFDNVEWGAILEVLEKCGFGDFFIKMVKILFKDPKSAVMNNGFWGGLFHLRKINKAGGPRRSPVIFICS